MTNIEKLARLIYATGDHERIMAALKIALTPAHDPAAEEAKEGDAA